MQLEVINDVLRQFIIDKHGTDVWDKVRARIGQVIQKKAKGANDGANTDTLSGDSLDFAREIINAVSQVLDTNIDDFQQDFGRAAFMMCLQLPQGKVLQSLGNSLCDFLNNLDNFVDIFVQAQELNDAKPPSFRCIVNDDGQCLELHYYSRRHGWESCVIGAVTCAAKVLYNLEVTMTLIQDIDITDHSHGDMDHSVFEIRKENEFLSVKKNTYSTAPSDLNISIPTLCCAFPFHIIFDKNMEIQQLGAALLRLIGTSLIQYGTSMTTYFELVRPDVKFTFESILCRINGSFFLLLKSVTQSVTIKDKILMELKGQMIHLPESNCILFLASPLVKKLEQLKGRGLFLSDIPIHDATRDLILVSEQAHAQDGLKKRMEQLQTELREASTELEEEKKKTEDLLSSIFPQDVATKLINKQTVPARFIENVTMLFSDIVGFTSICGKCTAMDVVEMLKDLYTEFDKLCGELDLYKVETIGDAYVVAGGVQSLHGTVEDGYKVAKMALGMIDYLENALSPEGLPLKMRIGIHTGSVLSGVVGTKMPRYCLFGHDVTLANKMETESEAGRINISPTTYELIRHGNGLKFIPRPKPTPTDGVKIDKISSGICYFLERQTILNPTNDEIGPLWKKLESPRILRKRFPPSTGNQSSNNCKSVSVRSPTLGIKDDSKPKASANGGSFFYDDKNGNYIRNPTKKQYFPVEFFKETSV